MMMTMKNSICLILYGSLVLACNNKQGGGLLPMDAGPYDAGLDAGSVAFPCGWDGGTFAILQYDYTSTAPQSVGSVEVGFNFSTHLFAGCGVWPYLFSTEGSLPDGLSMQASGIFSGTPSTATDGGWPFVVVVRDSDGGITQGIFSITVISNVGLGIGGNDGG